MTAPVPSGRPGSLKPGQLTFVDLVKEAFRRKAKVPMLGRMPINYMAIGAAGLLGFVNPGFWLLGLAGELGYLFFRSSSDRFVKLIEGERLLAMQQSWEERVHQAVERLSAASRARYRGLLDGCRRILGVTADPLAGDSLGDLRDLKTRHLNQLLAIFLRLLASREAIDDNLRGTDARSLERELSEVATRLAKIDRDAEPALARSLEGTAEILRKRHENLRRAEASLQVIDAELLRIEQQVELIREEAAVTGSPSALSDRLDAVTTTMNETHEWMAQHAELLGGFGTDDLVEGDILALPPEMVGEREG